MAKRRVKARFMMFSFEAEKPCGGLKDAVVSEVGHAPIIFKSVDEAIRYIPQIAHPLNKEVIHQIFNLTTGKVAKKLKMIVKLAD